MESKLAVTPNPASQLKSGGGRFLYPIGLKNADFGKGVLSRAIRPKCESKGR
jgi:hypothetical protein